MNRELRDELEVPGHVVAIETISIKEAKAELNSIMDSWEKQGYKKADDVPEGPLKQRYRELLQGLGYKVQF